ncbi:hypothetical protein [Rufibacter roseolus]|uniref:hypothetical protein n=1 Tax=Rufibacter roseolus TaxID=2817375 RepID=UPI001B307B3E|nr:hypothetical protein [Rufibacter roseolus]
MYYKPYEVVFQRKPDFRVTYAIFTQEEGGRYSLPFQGIRWDFQYEDPETGRKNFFIIWPEFEDLHGNVIQEVDLPIPRHGIARMWIVDSERINYH